MVAFGRFLQIAGLVILPLAMIMELTSGLGRAFGVSDMVTMLIWGASAFGIGYILEGLGRRHRS